MINIEINLELKLFILFVNFVDKNFSSKNITLGKKYLNGYKMFGRSTPIKLWLKFRGSKNRPLYNVDAMLNYLSVVIGRGNNIIIIYSYNDDGQKKYWFSLRAKYIFQLKSSYYVIP